MKKMHFSWLMKDIHKLKECNRLTLSDYYTRVSQRLAKLVTLLQRLVNKTDNLCRSVILYEGITYLLLVSGLKSNQYFYFQRKG